MAKAQRSESTDIDAAAPARRLGAWLAIGLAVLGPLLALATVEVLRRSTQGEIESVWVTGTLLADGCYVLLLVGLIAARAAALIATKRSVDGGAALHRRFTGAFTIVAVVPAILVAVFATVTINFGVEAWFSERVRSVIDGSFRVVTAYLEEQQTKALTDAEEIGAALNGLGANATASSVREMFLRRGAGVDLTHTFLVDQDGSPIYVGFRTYRFNFVEPPPDALRRALAGLTTTVVDAERGEIRVLRPLDLGGGVSLYATRRVNREALQHVEPTQSAVVLYRSLEDESQSLFFGLGLLYVAFAAFITLGAVWLGFHFADRLSAPISRLARAAERIRHGDLDTRVPEPRARDEIAALSRVFNQMAESLTQQRDELLRAREEEESERRFIEEVLGGVTAGVIGLDASGRIEVANPAAKRILGKGRDLRPGRQIGETFPEIAPEIERAGKSLDRVTEANVTVLASGYHREVVVRVAPERVEGGIRGFVVTFEDLTELVTAQRMAAWGDVARRMAHEVKNPLNPIQLAAERLRARIRAQDDRAQEMLDRYTAMIIRQSMDITQLIDAFSQFARMPTPNLREENLRKIVDDAAFLEGTGNPEVAYAVEGPRDLTIRCDRAMIAQAITNLLRNAAHAIQDRVNRDERSGDSATAGRITIAVRPVGTRGAVEIEVSDNGTGFPKEGRNALLEPYRSARAEGAGLGLAIVHRAVEAHGGTIHLLDRGDGAAGAVVRLRLPVAGAAGEGRERRSGA